MQDDAGTRTALAPAPGPVLRSDPHGFAALYIRHRTSFTSHARRYLRDPRDADEVVQEAFLRLFLAMPELETELQALAYCRRTITNLCIDRYRADARRPRLVTLEGAPVDELAEDDTGDPVVRAEDAALVRQALSQLPELHRAALVMREIEEKPLPVIADELDVAEDSVKHLLFRARRGLRKLLAGTSVAPGADAELTRGLRPLARGASGGAAGLLLLALLGLGSGPDLRAVPVVGVDLPDVLGVTAVAEAVGGAVRDVVGAIVPGDAAHASAAPREVANRPDSSRAAAADEGAGQPTGTRRAAELGAPGAAAAAPGSGRTTTVVTVVDGVPVVTVVPATSGLPAYGPASGVPQTAPGTSTGRGPGPFLPTPVAPGTPTGGREVPTGTPVGPALPAVDSAARAGWLDAPGRSPRAQEALQQAADKAADRAADTAEKVEKAADKSGDKAAVLAEKAQDKAEKVAQQTSAKVEQAEKAAAKASERAARLAADRAEQQAAAQRAAAAERAAAVRAAELAAAQAAERAAAAAAAQQQAAAVAAQQAAAAVVPVGAVATTVVPVPAP